MNNNHNKNQNKRNFKKWNKNKKWNNFQSEKNSSYQIPNTYGYYPNCYEHYPNFYGNPNFNQQMFNWYNPQPFYGYEQYYNLCHQNVGKLTSGQNYNKNNHKINKEEKYQQQNTIVKSEVKDISKINESIKTNEDKEANEKYENDKEEDKENKQKKIFIKIKNIDKMSEDDIMKEIDRQIMEELIKNISKNEVIDSSPDNKKPIIIIKQKKSQLSDAFSSLKSIDKKDTNDNENSCFLEDSDDDSDYLIHSYKEIIIKKKSERKINFVPIKNIIGNKEIKTIDDVLKICNYYEKNNKNNHISDSKYNFDFNSESPLKNNLSLESNDKLNEDNKISIKNFQTLKNEFKEVYSNINDILKNEESIFQISSNNINQSLILSKKLDAIHKMLRYIVLTDKIIREYINNIDYEFKNEIIDGIKKIKNFIEKNLENDASNNYLTIIKGIIEELDPIHNTFYSKMYKFKDNYYNINLEKVYKLKGPLTKLKKMIGLNNIKDQIIDMILYYLMEFEESNNNMLHMSIEGSPGCGKTKLAKILSKILCSLGILESDKVVYARRADLIGQYVGHTAIKTQKIIDSAIGGVLFIDEAYSLGSGKDKKESNSDSFSKECLDVLNQNLSDNKKKFICIIAGYSYELEKCFFSTNPGLPRRFPFRFKIDPYSGLELCKIFVNKVNRLGWKLDEDVEDLDKFFTKYKDAFKYFGGDIETFIQDIKYTHSRRVICGEPTDYKIISNDDIKKSFEKFKERRSNEIISLNVISSLYV